MSVLVTGGAGYIGSHMAHTLVERGEKVVILDNLSTGLQRLAPAAAEFIHGDVGDRNLVSRILLEHGVDCVIHFAGSTVVPDSVKDPLTYYANNTVSSRELISACIDAGVRHFIFSSTAAVYGVTDQPTLDENAETSPSNPYGRSKLATEWILEDAAAASSMRYVALRYFNVAGADPLGRTGQSTPRATHLIKRACQAALGQHSYLEIFGVDFPTHDGTGVRDYIHVSDLVSAHTLALDYLRDDGECAVFNCGYGRGFSVREVICAVEAVSGRRLETRELERRPGDPPAIVADPTALKRRLGWAPLHEDLGEIVRHAFDWETRSRPAPVADT
ncbi:UDP-glucose 4-epimerase GalE [Caulobacter segnis]